MIKYRILHLFCIIWLGWVSARGLYAEPASKQVAEYNSDFNEKVVVTDTGNLRDMLFLSSTSDYSHGTIDLDDPAKLISPFMKCMMVPLTFFEKKKQENLSVLVIGLGAGSIPRYLRKQYPKMRIDAVEIDPVVVNVAKNYFFVTEDENYRVHTDDGRAFLENTKTRYDIIFLDAYGPGDGTVSRVEDLPKQLATVEFFKLAKDRLKSQGVLVSNYIFVNQQHYSSFHLSLKKNFPLIYRFPIKREDESMDYNIILLAHRKSIPKFNKQVLKKQMGNLKKSVKSDLGLTDFLQYYNADLVDEDKNVVELRDL